MTDLTKITTPFGMLDEETKNALLRANYEGRIIERFTSKGRWTDSECSTWNMALVYRVKPEPAIELPWEVLAPRWKWAAADARGAIYVYDQEPICGETVWTRGGMCRRIDRLFSGITGRPNLAWDETLTKRPEGEAK